MAPHTTSLFTHASFKVQVFRMPPYAVAQCRGDGQDAARTTVREALADLLAREAEQVVLDLSGVTDASDGVVECLARSILEAQRLGRSVTLVRCSDELFRRLQRTGLSGAVTHAASLLGATRGLARDTAGNVDLHLRSSAEMLPRLRSVTAAVAREARLSPAAAGQLKAAVNEAATNAITHGSPQGPRNHVRVSFLVDADLLIVEVADQGQGFDPLALKAARAGEPREDGYGLPMMRAGMDRIEFFQDDAGMLVRMTKYLPG